MKTTAKDLSVGLRELADWIDQHPDLADTIADVHVGAYPADKREVVQEWARALQKADKNYTSTLFQLQREFGPVTLSASFWREKVCERVVVSTEMVTKTIPDPDFEVPTIEVDELVEYVEWRCEPIMGEA